MSKKPVNFYQGAKGTFKVEIIGKTIEDVTLYTATHTYEEIKQAIEDGFVPYCVIDDGDSNVGYYYLIYDRTLEPTRLTFDGNTEQVVIKLNDEVIIEDKESGSGGIAFHAYFFDSNRYVCDETGARVQFDSIVNLDPVEIPLFIMQVGGDFYYFYLVHMGINSARILSADGTNASTMVINKEEGTGYAIRAGLT